jgi:hypothetical protein
MLVEIGVRVVDPAPRQTGGMQRTLRAPAVEPLVGDLIGL